MKWFYFIYVSFFFFFFQETMIFMSHSTNPWFYTLTQLNKNKKKQTNIKQHLPNLINCEHEKSLIEKSPISDRSTFIESYIFIWNKYGFIVKQLRMESLSLCIHLLTRTNMTRGQFNIRLATIIPQSLTSVWHRQWFISLKLQGLKRKLMPEYGIPSYNRTRY